MAAKSNRISQNSEEAANVISSGSQRGKVSDVVQGITAVSDGVIGTGTVKRKAPVVKTQVQTTQDKVAIHSTKNVSWPGVGKIQKGYNIVTKEQAEKWLSRNHVRSATPEEVAQEFGQ
jgi:hypothetical protein